MRAPLLENGLMPTLHPRQENLDGESIEPVSVRQVDEGVSALGQTKDFHMTLTQIPGGAAAIVLLLGATTLLLPRHVHVERRTTLNADAPTILELAASGEG